MTTAETRIPLPLADLSYRRVESVKECCIVLYPEHLEYKIIARYEQLDEDTNTWKEKSANYRWTRKRSSMVEVEMVYCNKEKLYTVGIEFDGIAVTSFWHWSDPLVALAVYNQLKDYMLRGLL